jgi:hypothetical protein
VGERQVARILAECSPQDERWPEIIKLYCSVTSSLSSLGTRLRITPQSRRDGRDATLIPLPGGRKPWEDEDSEPDDPAAA